MSPKTTPRAASVSTAARASRRGLRELPAAWPSGVMGYFYRPGQSMLVAVTDHAAERFRQRVRGTLDPKAEIIRRVAHAREAGRGENGERGTILVRDLERRDLVYVCRPDHGELVVVTLWEQGDDAAV